MRATAAIIGGTGVGSRLEAMGGRPFVVPTPFGTMNGRFLFRGPITVAVISRHGSGHKTPPHGIDFRAIAWGMRHIGVKNCIASAAVGSLRTEFQPGTLAVCTDFLDLSGRNLTLFETTIRHTDFSQPMGDASRKALKDSLVAAGEKGVDRCVYVGMNGPRFETPAEVMMLAGLGGDVVGMTASSEATACVEAGVDYACLAMVSNMGCGLTASPLSHREVEEAIARIGEKATAIVLGAIERLAS